MRYAQIGANVEGVAGCAEEEGHAGPEDIVDRAGPFLSVSVWLHNDRDASPSPTHFLRPHPNERVLRLRPPHGHQAAARSVRWTALGAYGRDYHSPCEEGRDGKCRVEGRVGVRAGGGLDHATSAEPV